MGNRATASLTKCSRSYFSPAAASCRPKTPSQRFLRHFHPQSHPCLEGRVRPSAPISQGGSRALQDGSRAPSGWLTLSPQCQQRVQAADHQCLCSSGARHRLRAACVAEKQSNNHTSPLSRCQELAGTWSPACLTRDAASLHSSTFTETSPLTTESSAQVATHLGRGLQRAWPAPHLPLWKRCLCTPEGGRAEAVESQTPEPCTTLQALPACEQSQLPPPSSLRALPLPCPSPALFRKAEPVAYKANRQQLLISLGHGITLMVFADFST